MVGQHPGGRRADRGQSLEGAGDDVREVGRRPGCQEPGEVEGLLELVGPAVRDQLVDERDERRRVEVLGSGPGLVEFGVGEIGFQDVPPPGPDIVGQQALRVTDEIQFVRVQPEQDVQAPEVLLVRPRLVPPAFQVPGEHLRIVLEK